MSIRKSKNGNVVKFDDVYSSRSDYIHDELGGIFFAPGEAIEEESFDQAWKEYFEIDAVDDVTRKVVYDNPKYNNQETGEVTGNADTQLGWEG